jgi:adenine phosphoribosyltransferase
VSDDLRDDLRRRVVWVDGHADVWRTFWDGRLFARVAAALADPYRECGVTKVAGIEARGMILGAAVAIELAAGFVAVRKEMGLFPGPKIVRVTPTDYRGRRSTLRLQRGSVGPGDRVILVDDWFETGSQAVTARTMIEEAGAELVGSSVIVDQLSEDARRAIGNLAALIPYSALPPDGGEPRGESDAGAIR